MVRRFSAVAALVALIVGLCFMPAVAAQEDRPADGAASVSFDVVGPVPGGVHLVPVAVTVRAQRASRGVITVDVEQRAGLLSYVVPVDMPANTAVQVPLILPTNGNGLTASATLRIDGLEPVVESISRFPEPGGSLVGTLGVAADGNQVPLQIGGGTAAVRSLEADIVTTLGLEGLSTVVTTPAAVRELPEAGRATLLGWMANGGNLMVVGPRGSLDAELPASWRNDPTPVLGRLSYVDGDWQTQVLPANERTDPDALQMHLFGDNFWDLDVSPLRALAADAGLALPSGGIVALLLGAYVLIAGPLAYLVLSRMGRLRAAWLVLPGLALLFTVAAVAVGAGIRGGRTDSHVTVVEVHPVGSSADTTLLATASFQGSRDFELPQGWVLAAAGDLSGGVGSTSTTVRPDRNRTRLSLDLEAGGAGVVSLRGPAHQYDEALVLSDVRLVGDTVTAQVTNNLDVTLHELMLFAGHEAEPLPALEAGESRAVEIEFEAEPARIADEFRAGGWELRRNWNRNGDGIGDNEFTNPGAWASWRLNNGWNTFAPGTVGIAGWTNELPAPFSGDTDGRTVFVSRVAVPDDPATDGADPAAVSLQVASQTGGGADDLGVNNLNFFGNRYVLAIDASTGSPGLRVAAGVSGLEVWIDGGWEAVALPGAGALTLRLPPEAVGADGQMWLRSSVGEWVWPSLPGVVAVSPENAQAASLGGALVMRNGGGGFNEPFDQPAVQGNTFAVLDLVPGELQTFDGELFGAIFDVYTVDLTVGQQLEVKLLSDVHDSNLVVRDPRGFVSAENDDLTVCCDSGVTLTATTDGTYRIEASELGNSGSGGYTLLVTLLGEEG